MVARIRRLFYAEHWKVGTSAAELGVHHDAVRRAIDVDRFATGARRIPASRLDPYKDFVEETLDRHPRLRATRLHEMLRARGFPGSVVQLRRYVATVRPVARAEAYLQPAHAARRAGPGGLGALRQAERGPRLATAELLRAGARLVARDVRPLLPRPDRR